MDSLGDDNPQTRQTEQAEASDQLLLVAERSLQADGVDLDNLVLGRGKAAVLRHVG